MNKKKVSSGKNNGLDDKLFLVALNRLDNSLTVNYQAAILLFYFDFILTPFIPKESH